MNRGQNFVLGSFCGNGWIHFFIWMGFGRVRARRARGVGFFDRLAVASELIFTFWIGIVFSQISHSFDYLHHHNRGSWQVYLLYNCLSYNYQSSTPFVEIIQSHIHSFYSYFHLWLSSFCNSHYMVQHLGLIKTVGSYPTEKSALEKGWYYCSLFVRYWWAVGINYRVGFYYYHNYEVVSSSLLLSLHNFDFFCPHLYFLAYYF